MKIEERAKRGIEVYLDKTGLSRREASTKAGFGPAQVDRFMHKGHSMTLKTFEELCSKSFGTTAMQVLKHGK